MERFVFPKSFYDSIKTFKPVQRDMLYTAIFKYVFDDEATDFTNNDLLRLWVLIKPILTKSKKISATKSEQYSDNVATMSGHSQNNIKTMSQQDKNNVETRLNTRLKEREKEKDKGEEKKDKEKSANAATVSRFIKPTLEQVKQFVAEKGYHFDAVAFHAFYESKGWRVGNQPMKSWEAACITWEKREPHPEVKEEVKQKPVPKVTQCPTCGSYELRITLDRVMCKSCGAVYDYNHTKAKWEAV